MSQIVGPEGEAPIISYQMRLPIWENKASGKQMQRDQACRATAIISALGVSKACGPAHGPTTTATLFDQPPARPIAQKRKAPVRSGASGLRLSQQLTGLERKGLRGV